MGAVHGVAYKYVAIAAAASYGAYLSQPHSYARLGLGLIGATNSVIVVLFVADRGTQLLGKDAVTGKAPWYRALPWAGFLLPTWLYTYVHTLVGRVDTATEVAPGWWLGGRYADRAPGRPERWAGVLDLTVELPERCLDLCDDYLLVRCWDGAAPHLQDLEHAAAFCATARRRGPVLVHCAHGRGRSTTAMCAALVRAGVDRDWRGAFERCRRARPCVRLNKRMRAALDAWAAEYPSPGS